MRDCLTAIIFFCFVFYLRYFVFLVRRCVNTVVSYSRSVVVRAECNTFMHCSRAHDWDLNLHPILGSSEIEISAPT